MHAQDVKSELKGVANPNKAEVMRHFFKTGEGQYGEGDIFIGVTVPNSRKVAKKFGDLALQEIRILLNSLIHEERLVAILILVHKYTRASCEERDLIFKFYLSNSSRINNWDLVDVSAPNVLGAHLFAGDRRILYRLAKSDNVWERRMSIVATLYFIRKNDFSDTFKIAELLLQDRHDLIHKAAGWMLREVGKKNFAAEEVFVVRHHLNMPRTMLRYAIEKFPESKKRSYMQR